MISVPLQHNTYDDPHSRPSAHDSMELIKLGATEASVADMPAF